MSRDGDIDQATRHDNHFAHGFAFDPLLHLRVGHRLRFHRGLVEEQGRLEQVGRPIIYGTTFEFLQQFGITSLEELPPLLADDDATTLA